MAMIVTIVHIYVKPEFVAEFIEATRRNHEGSVREPCNLRFDVLQDSADPTKFVLYEAYATEEAVTAHKETPHYAKWRDKVSPWMQKPREGVKHTMLFPKAAHTDD